MESKGPGLYEFLIEAELEHYYNSIKNDLKIQNTSQLKYVTEEDLYQLGMSKPEMRRLKKYFNKYYPQNYLSKFKKMLLPNKNDQKLNGWQGVGGSGIGPPSEEGRCGAANERTEPHRMPNKHIISAESIVVNKELGMGEFGVVQQGVWTNDGDRIQVAIKCLSRERMQSNPIEFLKEAAIMHSIDHEHIVRLYGVVLDTDSLMLVTELAPLRSLLECLKEPSLRASFPVLTLCDFALQICDGMQYLENKRLIHRDLAARNILVFSKNKVKISDFGLSRALGQGKDYYQTNFNVHLKLPIAWCAPECISYLRFTSASDVWAYGVTLWEMFSYGFQPWAALTGHQILEAIDEPNYQRLEQPECCPREYYGVMNRCWTHDPVKRPKFSELAAMLPECRPEQVQAVAESEPGPSRKDKLQHRVGDIITVLDKGAVTSAGGSAMWKGVLANGKTGLFDPAHTVAYIGTNLPSAPNRPTDTFSRSESKYSSTRRKLRSEMISAPQGDLKHTGHVGLDGAYFGDLFYFGQQYNHLPRQVVAPYKPHEDLDQTPLLQATAGGGLPSLPQPLTNLPSAVTPGSTSLHASDHIALSARQLEQLTPPECWPPQPTLQTDHEYHEISDEENLVADSPRSEKTFDFGPSLLDEMETMFRNLKSPLPGTPASPLDHDGVNKCNELRELTSRLGHKKKQAAVKPISAHDQKILDSAIELATELTARSMNDLESEPLPTTPMSPNKRKFSFRFPNTGGASDADGGKNERRNFSEEAQSIPDLQSTLTEEAELAYKSLVEVPTPEVAINNHMMCSDNPLRMLKSGNISVIKPRIKTKLKPVKKPSAESVECIDDDDEVFVDGKEMVSKEQRQGQKNSSVSSETCVPPPSYTECRSEDNNPIPLPPRDRSKMTSVSKRHTRKHPLIIPASSIQRTLNKVNVITPEDISTNNSIRGFDFSQNRVKIVPDGKMATEPAYINHNPFKQQIEDTDFDTQSLHFEEQIDSNLAALDELEETSQEFGDSFKQRNVFLNDENMKSTQHRIDTARLKKNFLESAERKNGGDFECKKQGESVLTDNEALLRHATDHVSCEDLLEFADTKPSPRARGLESDQVRIMSKVLGTEISAEQCLLALEHSNWDVHKAIKLTKLQNILKTEHPFVDLGLCNGALAANQWDLNRAANWVVAANQDGDITQV